MLFCVAYPFFILQKEPKGISGTRQHRLPGQSRALTVWSAGSFVLEKTRKLKIRPEGSEKQVNLAGTKENFPIIKGGIND